jgi:hypothetical protein
MAYLQTITLSFPQNSQELFTQLGSLFSSIISLRSNEICFTTSASGMLPHIHLACSENQYTYSARFQFSNAETHRIEITNTTGMSRQHPGGYQALPMQQVCQRLAQTHIRVLSLDHAGFNLPWFDGGLHPLLHSLSKKLSAASLYHTFPGGEPWDFILPGDTAEIDGSKPIDYNLLRQPKFELVSFDKSSRPLIQLDMGLNCSFKTLHNLFPEALDESALGKIWVYLKNPGEVDICLVMGTHSSEDWSSYFRGCRI